MKEIIKKDLYRYGCLSGKMGLLKGFTIPGFRFTYFHRKASMTKNIYLKIIYKFILRCLSYKYGFQIPTTVEIGEGFYIGHHGTIVINSKVKIGKNCNLAHLITIGQSNRGKKRGVPIIEDNVWIGTGSVIIGKITIGTNSLIAPNSYVNFDVPPNSIVIGNPAKIVESEDATKNYIENILK